MEIRPILSTLRRHKTAAVLIVLEIALTCAILCNALFLVAQRLETLNMPSGMDDAHLIMARATGIGTQVDANARTREDLAALLWSGSDPVIARGNLRRTLSDLRRVLEPPAGQPVFVANRSTIRFAPDADVDAIRLGAVAPVSVAETISTVPPSWRCSTMPGNWG